MQTKTNAYTEILIKDANSINVPDINQVPSRISITGNDGVDYTFVYDQKNEKYYFARDHQLRKEIYFTFFETDLAVKISDIDLKYLSHLSLGTKILSFTEHYTRSKQKDMVIMLCSNYWLINHLRKKYPESQISIYDFSSENRFDAKMSELDVLQSFKTFLVKVEEPYPTEIYFHYNEDIGRFMAEQEQKFQISFEQKSRPSLVFDDQGNAMVIKDFQIYCWNQIATITVPFSGSWSNN